MNNIQHQSQGTKRSFVEVFPTEVRDSPHKKCMVYIKGQKVTDEEMAALLAKEIYRLDFDKALEEAAAKGNT
ncbi:hypothetical protein EG328_005533 [Venturia inaequalis]|uniref:Uncharacterized protein n=1 Tax=Venturia inaequalis TaxID=5025 RepID=A0A8H3ULK2_VENIN|nr:hypothetical protein EG328_005533 [Venturia inaequalis]